MCRVPEQLRQWLSQAVETGASDLHLIAGYPPVLRLHGDLAPLAESIIAADEAGTMLAGLCSIDTLARLHAQKSVDFSFQLDVGGRPQRIRANIFYAGRHLAGCLRIVPAEIPDFEWAGFPPPLAKRLASVHDGLVIVTGVTGSGKTTTLAMIVNLLNQAGGYRIITVEDPVEYLYPKAADSVLTQREVGSDVN